MARTTRISVSLPHAARESVRAYAQQRGLGLAYAARTLIVVGLGAETAGAVASDQNLALATLLAAEQAILMVAGALPGGEHMRRQTENSAMAAAERRLAALDGEAG